MKQKVLSFTSLLYVFSSGRAFAHEIGEAEKTPESISLWIYVISALFLISLLGYGYTFYLNRRLNQDYRGKKQKKIRGIKQMLSKKRQQMFLTSTVILVISIVMAGIWAFIQPKQGGIDNLESNVHIDVETFKSEGRDHIEVGDPTPSYKTFPPTSGSHSTKIVDYGYYENPLPFELLVHNLEHGDIIIYYKPSVTNDTKEHLQYIGELTHKGSGVIVVPNEKIEGEVVATAWTKRMILSTFNEEKIGKFINEFIYDGPEKLAPKN
jgi:hypothetical protein